MIFRKLIVFVMVTVLFLSCDKDMTGISNQFVLSGIVKESSSELPIAEANIHFTFLKNTIYKNTFPRKTHITSLTSQVTLHQNYPNPFNPETTISFSLPSTGRILLEIFWWPKYELIKTLFNDTIPAGNHQIIWDGTNNDDQYVTNGIYVYRLTTKDTIIEKTMILHIMDPEYIKTKNCIPISKTDNKGEFSIGYDQLPPVGFTMPMTNALGEEIGMISISDTFNIILLKQDYINRVEAFHIDAEKNIFLNLQMDKAL